MTVRPYRDQDRAQILAFLRDPRAIDSPGHHVHVVEEEGRIVGVSVGVTPPDKDNEAILGTILLEDPTRMDLLHKLMLTKVEHAVELGYEHGSTITRRRNLVELGEKVYGVKPEPSGWHPVTGDPVEWTFRAHLPTFLAQLRRMG